MTLKVFPSKHELNEALADWICKLVSETLKNQEYFTLALSGGETPKMLYQKLASPAYIDKLNWKRIHVFWGDERMVPADDDRNNAKMAYDNLLALVDIPEGNVHRMRVDIEAYFAVENYTHLLHNYFNNRGSSFDLILLGLGEDGHTLSLFPGAEIAEDSKSWVATAYNKEHSTTRITLLPPVVNKASNLAFIVTGENKADTVQRVLEGPYAPEKIPAQLIKAANGELHWFLDSGAAGKLTK